MAEGAAFHEIACSLHHSGALQTISSVHTVMMGLVLTIANVVFYIKCICPVGGKYVGSPVDMKKRLSQHKNAIRNDNWSATGLARHFGQCHRVDRETGSDIIRLLQGGEGPQEVGGQVDV